DYKSGATTSTRPPGVTITAEDEGRFSTVLQEMVAILEGHKLHDEAEQLMSLFAGPFQLAVNFCANLWTHFTYIPEQHHVAPPAPPSTTLRYVAEVGTADYGALGTGRMSATHASNLVATADGLDLTGSLHQAVESFVGGIKLIWDMSIREEMRTYRNFRNLGQKIINTAKGSTEAANYFLLAKQAGNASKTTAVLGNVLGSVSAFRHARKTSKAARRLIMLRRIKDQRQRDRTWRRIGRDEHLEGVTLKIALETELLQYAIDKNFYACMRGGASVATGVLTAIAPVTLGATAVVGGAIGAVNGASQGSSLFNKRFQAARKLFKYDSDHTLNSSFFRNVAAVATALNPFYSRKSLAEKALNVDGGHAKAARGEMSGSRRLIARSFWAEFLVDLITAENNRFADQMIQALYCREGDHVAWRTVSFGSELPDTYTALKQALRKSNPTMKEQREIVALRGALSEAVMGKMRSTS
ncbi:MAG: hypothetical protein AAGC55_27140, partial [Myxococcota bacterium]